MSASLKWAPFLSLKRGAHLFKYVWPFSGHQAQKEQKSLQSIGHEWIRKINKQLAVMRLQWDSATGLCSYAILNFDASSTDNLLLNLVFTINRFL